MSCILPPEMLDTIIDHLYGEQVTLKLCCLVSRSWVSRARKHLFAHIEFHPLGSPDLDGWMKAFPDPSNSPSHYTRILSIHGPPVIAFASNLGYPWIRSFSYVVELEVDAVWSNSGPVSLASLHGLSPVLKSLSLSRSTTPIAE